MTLQGHPGNRVALFASWGLMAKTGVAAGVLRLPQRDGRSSCCERARRFGIDRSGGIIHMIVGT